MDWFHKTNSCPLATICGPRDILAPWMKLTQLFTRGERGLNHKPKTPRGRREKGEKSPRKLGVQAPEDARDSVAKK